MTLCLILATSLSSLEDKSRARDDKGIVKTHGERDEKGARVLSFNAKQATMIHWSHSRRMRHGDVFKNNNPSRPFFLQTRLRELKDGKVEIGKDGTEKETRG